MEHIAVLWRLDSRLKFLWLKSFTEIFVMCLRDVYKPGIKINSSISLRTSHLYSIIIISSLPLLADPTPQKAGSATALRYPNIMWDTNLMCEYPLKKERERKENNVYYRHDFTVIKIIYLRWIFHPTSSNRAKFRFGSCTSKGMDCKNVLCAWFRQT